MQNHRLRLLSVMLGLMVLTVALLAIEPCLAQGTTTPRFRVEILRPMYIYPSTGVGRDAWLRTIQAHSPATGVNLTLIANQESGHFTSKNSDYEWALKTAKAAGCRVIVYVDTNYGKNAIRNGVTVDYKTRTRADVDAWYRLYPGLIDGVFLDVVASDAATANSFYAPLYTYIRQKQANAFIVSNPGVPDCAAELFTGPTGRRSDVVVTWEQNERSVPISTYRKSAYLEQNFIPSRFAAIVHTSPDLRGVQICRSKGIGFYFVTDDIGPPPVTAINNPFDAMPTFWSPFVQKIREVNVGY